MQRHSEQFDPSNPESFQSYIERLDCWFLAKDTAAEKKSAIFLAAVGPETYEIARNLCAPNLPSTKTYEELVRVLGQYFAPKVNTVAARFQFHKRIQQPNESVATFMNALRCQAAKCSFGEFQTDALRDQLVCGLKNPDIQRRCLAEGNLTLEAAYELAVSMESATTGQSLIKPEQVSTVASVRRDLECSPKPGEFCYRCHSKFHKADKCKFKKVTCNFCHKIGHIEKACRKKEARLAAQENLSMSDENERTKSKPVAERKSAVNKKKGGSVKFCEKDLSESDSSTETVGIVEHGEWKH